MARGAAYQHIQLGLETTPGTTVAANKQLLGTMMVPRPRIPTDTYRSVGNIFTSDLTVQKETTEFDINGALAFNDLCYLLAACLIQPAAGMTFKPDPFNPNTIKTYTVEHGSSAQAEKCGYFHITSLALTFNPRGAQTVRGTGVARTLVEGVTITASPTAVPKILVPPRGIDVYVADTVAGLSSGKLGKGLELSFNIGSRFNQLFTFDSTQDSFKEHVERAPDMGANLRIEHDTYSAGLMTDLRSAKQKFLRVICTGPEFSVGNPYKIQLTFPFKFREPDPGASQDVWTYNYGLQPTYESGFASGVEFVVTTDMVSL